MPEAESNCQGLDRIRRHLIIYSGKNVYRNVVRLRINTYSLTAIINLIIHNIFPRSKLLPPSSI